ncbi:hypothetical protein J6590_022686 [Homalodisca vitripennis]|nr:hypothetical protein J6590_022686 [Homalodisca vitripennis]
MQDPWLHRRVVLESDFYTANFFPAVIQLRRVQQHSTSRTAKRGRPSSLDLIEQGKLYNHLDAWPHYRRDTLYFLKNIPPILHAFFTSLKTSEEVKDTTLLTDHEDFDKEED